MRALTQHHLEVFGTWLAALLAIAVVATPIGRDALAWVYLQSAQAIEHGVHLPFPLDRLDPTCPDCM